MAVNLTFLYRGPLKSCNYNCGYCPFPKEGASDRLLDQDRESLYHFVDWIRQLQGICCSILFTPWGEALTYPWYPESIHQLSRMPHVSKVVAQTNLSSELGWLADTERSKIALWCTYHPDHVESLEFLGKCNGLDTLKIRHSVGMVGIREHLPYAIEFRKKLNKNTYLWINAYKHEANYYSDQDLTSWKEIDPLFELNHQQYESMGQSCRCGKSVFSIDGTGNIYRCHFVKECLGNIDSTDIRNLVSNGACPNNTCGCYIGYVHLEHLLLERYYGSRILERIPIQYQGMD
jgi:MoaA/NifB/PqqE/SkfB family radical SAM enzyme